MPKDQPVSSKNRKGGSNSQCRKPLSQVGEVD